MDKGFCVIEGVCCAGKTTLLNSFKNEGFYVIPETNKMGIDFPPPPTCYEEARRNERFILGLEKERCKMGKQGSNGQLCFADRMLPSVIAISCAYSVKRGYNTLDDLFADIIAAIDEEPSSFYCDSYIYLKVSTETVIKRNSMLEKPLDDFWVGREIMDLQIKFYELYESIMKSQSWKTIQADNLSTAEIRKLILEHEVTPKSATKETMINEYKALWAKCKEVGLA